MKYEEYISDMEMEGFVSVKIPYRFKDSFKYMFPSAMYTGEGGNWLIVNDLVDLVLDFLKFQLSHEKLKVELAILRDRVSVAEMEAEKRKLESKLKDLE